MEGLEPVTKFEPTHVLHVHERTIRVRLVRVDAQRVSLLTEKEWRTVNSHPNWEMDPEGLITFCSQICRGAWIEPLV